MTPTAVLRCAIANIEAVAAREDLVGAIVAALGKVEPTHGRFAVSGLTGPLLAVALRHGSAECRAALAPHLGDPVLGRMMRFAATTPAMTALARDREAWSASAHARAAATRLLRHLGLAGEKLNAVLVLEAPGVDGRVSLHVASTPASGTFRVECGQGTTRTLLEDGVAGPTGARDSARDARCGHPLVRELRRVQVRTVSPAASDSPTQGPGIFDVRGALRDLMRASAP